MFTCFCILQLLSVVSHAKLKIVIKNLILSDGMTVGSLRTDTALTVFDIPIVRYITLLCISDILSSLKTSAAQPSIDNDFVDLIRAILQLFYLCIQLLFSN